MPVIKEQKSQQEKKKWLTSVDKNKEKKNTTNVNHPKNEKSPPAKAVKTRKADRENLTSEDIFPPPSQEKVVDKSFNKNEKTNVDQCQPSPKKRERKDYHRQYKTNQRAEQEGIKNNLLESGGLVVNIKDFEEAEDLIK
jgi:hypothetical protein